MDENLHKAKLDINWEIKAYRPYSHSPGKSYKYKDASLKKGNLLTRNRKIILNSINHNCSFCDNIAKYVHHIDQSKKNHDLSNLLPLCPSCHQWIHKLLREGFKIN